jgi:uncharacterized membrane protein YhaH (DUF805 family)
MTQELWYYANKNVKQGPVPADQIPGLIETKVIGADTLVWTDGMDNWAPAKDAIPASLYPQADDSAAPPLGAAMGPPSFHPTNFVDSVKTVFNKYAVFQGRARRPEFWWFTLFSVAGGIALLLLDYTLFGIRDFTVLDSIWHLALLVPTIAVGARRLHDIGKSGWWQLVGIIPILGWILVIYWFCQPGDSDHNEYGPE